MLRDTELYMSRNEQRMYAHHIPMVNLQPVLNTSIMGDAEL